VNSLTRLLELVDSAVDWPIYCIDIPPRWSSNSGRTIITGDAAHAMVPYMALGAAMAVEDAAALAASLTHLRDITESGLKRAISKWMEARVPRVSQVHAASFGHGLILHFPDGPVQVARDEALKSDLDEGKDRPVHESPNQWNDPVVTHWAYTHDPVAEVEKIWANEA
jgi:salicylate hydroxylase